MNEKDIPSIWDAPAFLPYIQPPLTQEIVEAAEVKIGYRLPKEYIDLLYMQNGGYINYTLPDKGHRIIYGIGPSYPSITRFEWLEEYEGALSFAVKGLIPFDEDGDWSICLDYRKNKSEPAITFIVIGSDYEEHIAANFKKYLQKLVPTTQYEIVYDTDQSSEELTQQLSGLLGIQFTMTDAYNFGYSYYSARYDDDAWISIKSNKVPRAYLRAGDSCYEGYLSLQDEMAVRYPAIPVKALLIEASTSHRERVFNDLTNKGFTLKLIEDYL